MESIGGKTGKELLVSQISSDNRSGEEVYITGPGAQLTPSQLRSLLLFQVATVATSQDGTLTYRRHEDTRE
jgi:ABC-type iron transport system FetAB ATPase subunit